MDPASGIGIPLALAAGLVSFLSPCVLPLVPGYLSAVSGVNPSELEGGATRRVIVPAGLFVASFSLIFVLLGVSATAIGSALQANRDLLEKIAAAVIIAFGLIFVASPFVVRLNREWHVEALMRRGSGRATPRRRRVRRRLDAISVRRLARS